MINLSLNIRRERVGVVMLKNKNIWKLIWVIGIYAILVLILYLVVLYKVKWEDLDLSKYLYFYNCTHELCTSETPVDNYYSYLLCENNVCPYITAKKDNIVILKNEDKSYVYDYIDNKIINDSYNSYNFTSDDYLIATDSNNLQGIIDYEGKTIIDFKYQKITSYNSGYITYKENNKIGITNQDSKINITPKYDDVVLIDNYKFAYVDENSYYIAEYSNELPISNTIYDYIYAQNNIIFTIKDSKIDILDTGLRSKLLMKIDTYYRYKTEKERNSLDLYIKDNILYFNVYLGNNEYKQYKYDISNNKLYN